MVRPARVTDGRGVEGTARSVALPEAVWCSTGTSRTSGASLRFSERHGMSRSTCTVCFLCVFTCWITTVIGDRNRRIFQGPVHRFTSFRCFWRNRGRGQNNQTSWSAWKATGLTRASKQRYCVSAAACKCCLAKLWASRIALRNWSQ